VKVISLTGKNRCTETEEEVLENDELGFSDPIGSEEALITCRADTSLTQKPPGIYEPTRKNHDALPGILPTLYVKVRPPQPPSPS
jgi:hypothetical protein